MSMSQTLSFDSRSVCFPLPSPLSPAFSPAPHFPLPSATSVPHPHHPAHSNPSPCLTTLSSTGMQTGRQIRQLPNEAFELMMKCPTNVSPKLTAELGLRVKKPSSSLDSQGQPHTFAFSSISASDSSSQRSKSGARNTGRFSCLVSLSHHCLSFFFTVIFSCLWVTLKLGWEKQKCKSYHCT